MARRLLVLPAALLALALGGSPANAACAGEAAIPTGATLDAAREATLCLLNEQRAARGLRPLRHDDRLRVAADAHSREMVEHHFFDHVSPVSGSTVDLRVEATDYLEGADGWRIGENLAWGSGELATPARAVDGWMNSDGHRRNILTRGFRDIGIGIVPGAPTQIPVAHAAATYATEFGSRG